MRRNALAYAAQQLPLRDCTLLELPATASTMSNVTRTTGNAMKPFIRLTFVVSVSLSASVHADTVQLRNDPKRPVDKISRDLGVTQEDFVRCFYNVHSAPKGSKPRRDSVHANKAVLLPCLQKANPAITNEQLDAVMDRYRPGGHEAQEPSQ